MPVLEFWILTEIKHRFKKKKKNSKIKGEKRMYILLQRFLLDEFHHLNKLLQTCSQDRLVDKSPQYLTKMQAFCTTIVISV